MNKKVIISCDSTADMPKELTEKHNIKVFSTPIIMGEKTYKDGVDISPKDLFDYHDKTGKLAQTCAPNVSECMEYFNSINEDGAEIVHFDISCEMSSTYANATLAANDLGNVYTYDSRNLSSGIALQVLKACEMRDEGLSAGEIVEKLKIITPKIDASFVIDTLLYLRKGGRCSSLAAMGANLLKLKPCIEVINGKMETGKKYRGKLIDVISGYVEERLRDLEDIDTETIFVTHTTCSREIVDTVIKKVKSFGKFKNIYETVAGGSISVHCGPGTLGVLFIRKSDIKKK